MAENSIDDKLHHLSGQIAGLHLVCGAIISQFARSDKLRAGFIALLDDLVAKGRLLDIDAMAPKEGRRAFRDGIVQSLSKVSDKIIRDPIK